MKIQFFIIIMMGLVWAQDFQDIVCSGFVEFPTDEQFNNLNFSELEVHLYTLDGQLVEKSSCANNGFYLLPVYDLKDFYLKVVSKDQILQFKPNKLPLDFSRNSFKEAKEYCENQLNFKWSGFQLQDKIHIFLENDKESEQIDLSNIELELLDQSQNIIDSVKTNQRAEFTFNDIQIGQYTIRAKEGQNYYFRQTAKQMECVIAWPKGKSCTGSITIQGFDVSGNLRSENEALQGLIVEIFSTESPESYYLPGCQSGIQYQKQNSQQDSSSLCKKITTVDGRFDFPSVPLGKYRIYVSVPKVDQGPAILEIEPNYIDITMNGGNLHLNQEITINKISVVGKVVNPKGQGVSGVKIFLDGQYLATSNSRGDYTLQGIRTGVYTLESQHEDLIFEPLNNLKISASTKEIPAIPVKYLSLCGQVNLNTGNSIQIEEEQSFSNLKIIIYLENKNEKSEKRTVPISKDFKYCFEAKPGNYLVYPTVSNQERGKEITWQPQNRNVDLTGESQLNVNFERKILIQGGTIQFKHNIPSEVVTSTKIRLLSTRDSNKVIQELQLEQFNTATSISKFLFQNILHGQYQVNIFNPLLCFAQNTVPLIITATSVSELHFDHIGYILNYDVAQPIPATLELEGTTQKVTFQPNNNQLCVDGFGRYLIKVDQCFKADPQEQIYDIQNNQQIFTTSVEFIRLEGNIKVDVPENQVDLKNLLRLDVQQTSLNGKIENEVLNLVQQDQQTYTYTVFVKQGYTVTLKPFFISETDLTENLLFEPRFRTISVGNDCLSEIQTFTINHGFVYQGRFDKPIKDATLKVYSNSQIFKVLTVSGQEFKLGPYLWKNDYSLEVEKDGYNFQVSTAIQNHLVNVKIQVERLSSIRINVVDEKSKPLPNVMIFITTISKTQNARINSQTNEDGLYQTYNLTQGDYMVKAFLKEYIFEPSSKSISLKAGQEEVILIEGKKVAFSIFGKVQDFNKDGVDQATIEAYAINTPEGGLPKETAITDRNGNYRIRGLEPHKKYILKVKYEQNQGNSQIIISPQQFEITVGKEDIYDRDFILLQKVTTFLIQGRLLIDQAFTQKEQKQIGITSFEVYSIRNLEEPLTNIRKLRFGSYYEVELNEPQDVVIKIVVQKEKEKTELTQFSKDFQIQVSKQQLAHSLQVTVMINVSFIQQQNIDLQKPQIVDQKTSMNISLFTPLWFIFLVVAIFNFDKASYFFQKLFV